MMLKKKKKNVKNAQKQFDETPSQSNIEKLENAKQEEKKSKDVEKKINDKKLIELIKKDFTTDKTKQTRTSDESKAKARLPTGKQLDKATSAKTGKTSNK